MYKTNPIIFLVIILSLSVFIISLTMVLFFLSNNIMLPIIISFLFFFGVIFLAFKLSSGSFEKRMTLYKICSSCHKEVDINSEFCQYCGTSFSELIICEYCGTKNKHTETNCVECNAQLH